MLDFIYMGSADLYGKERERKIQNENICFQRDSNPHHASPRQESQRLRPLPPRSDQVNGAVANEIKHVHSPEVIVVLDPIND